jgi:hypothetical protein
MSISYLYLSQATKPKRKKLRDMRTIAQQDRISRIAQGIFEDKFTSDLWHFSTEFELPNMTEFECHSDMGSFRITIRLNEKRQALKSTFKAEKL